MKNLIKIKIVLIATLTFTSNLDAQTIELTGSYGYQFGTKEDYKGGYFKLDDGGQWNAVLGYELQEDIMVEVSYTRINSPLLFKDVYVTLNQQNKLADVAQDWIMVGGNKYFTKGNLKPFLGGSVGVAVFSPNNEDFKLINSALNNFLALDFDNQVRFAFSFKGGVNIMISDNVGINLQGNLMFPVDWAGVYLGTGGAGVSVDGTTLVGGFSGGLVFRLDR